MIEIPLQVKVNLRVRLTGAERLIIRLHKARNSVYEIELETTYSQEFIEKVLYFYDRLKESDIGMV